MPEHRPGTPAAFRLLESFLWHDFDEGAAAWAAWLRHREIEAEAPAASFAAAMRLHSALREMQEMNAGLRTGGEARERINQMIDALGVRPFIDPAGDLRLLAPQTGGPVGPLLVAALAAMSSGAWTRFRLCREPTCRASFYDSSKAARKIWCEMSSCGSQNKMRRYRARR